MTNTLTRMLRLQQLIFVASLLALSWHAMMAVHEFGHVIGAFGTGGDVQRVVLHPLTISRTDVSPNPDPSIVVWLGPVLGCLIPAAIWLLMSERWIVTRRLAKFFAGFCLVANGAYISLGSFDRIGDCGVMLDHGSPLWLLLAFGAVTIPLGFCVWHSLGSVTCFISDPNRVDPAAAKMLAIAMVVIMVLELIFSST